MDERIARYAYEYRNPQGLKIILDEAGISGKASSRMLIGGLAGFRGYRGKQFNTSTLSYQELPEWIDWFNKNRSRIRVRR